MNPWIVIAAGAAGWMWWRSQKSTSSTTPEHPAVLAQRIVQDLKDRGPRYDRTLMKAFQAAVGIPASGLYDARTRSVLVALGIDPAELPPPKAAPKSAGGPVPGAVPDTTYPPIITGYQVFDPFVFAGGGGGGGGGGDGTGVPLEDGEVWGGVPDPTYPPPDDFGLQDPGPAVWYDPTGYDPSDPGFIDPMTGEHPAAGDGDYPPGVQVDAVEHPAPPMPEPMPTDTAPMDTPPLVEDPGAIVAAFYGNDLGALKQAYAQGRIDRKAMELALVAIGVDPRKILEPQPYGPAMKPTVDASPPLPPTSPQGFGPKAVVEVDPTIPGREPQFAGPEVVFKPVPPPLPLNPNVRGPVVPPSPLMAGPPGWSEPAPAPFEALSKLSQIVAKPAPEPTSVAPSLLNRTAFAKGEPQATDKSKS